MKSEKLQDLVIKNLEELKAIDIVALAIHNLTDIADYMVICSGTSSRHVDSVANNLIEKIKQHGIRPFGVEEAPGGEWTLVDFGDVIVHVMLPGTREFYKLEKLWAVDLAKKKRKTVPHRSK
jgi:ribosome-associated protein